MRSDETKYHFEREGASPNELGEVTARAQVPGDVWRDLPLRLDLYNHSPTGFEWGSRRRKQA